MPPPSTPDPPREMLRFSASVLSSIGISGFDTDLADTRLASSRGLSAREVIAGLAAESSLAQRRRSGDFGVPAGPPGAPERRTRTNRKASFEVMNVAHHSSPPCS